MSEYIRGGGLVPNGPAANANIPTTLANISFNQFYGAQNAFIIGSSGSPVNIGAQTDFNLRTWCVAQGWNGLYPLLAYVNVNAEIKASSVVTFAFAVASAGQSFPASSSINITVNAGQYIVGSGGVGGDGGSGGPGGDGGVGGVAFYCPPTVSASLVNITNNGIIGGGGGGGGGGGYDVNSAGIGGGGGGGAAYANGGLSGFGADGWSATQTAGGAGGTPYHDGGYGGDGGGLGGAGYEGAPAGSPGGWGGGVGGLAGAATNGAANVTWLATGTRYGSVG
jgi:hypothetical protein